MACAPVPAAQHRSSCQMSDHATMFIVCSSGVLPTACGHIRTLQLWCAARCAWTDALQGQQAVPTSCPYLTLDILQGGESTGREEIFSHTC